MENIFFIPAGCCKNSLRTVVREIYDQEWRSFLPFNPVTWSFCIFFKRNLAYLYPHRFSQITRLSFIYLTEAVLICKKISSILTLYLLPDQNGIRGEKCHTLRSNILKKKNLSTLTGILLIRGTMGYHFLSFFLSFFSGGYRGTPNSTAGHLSIFSARLSSTCSFLFPRNILIFA